MRFLKTALVVALVLVAVPATAATITYVDLGTAAPPATLGGRTMTLLPTEDPRATGSAVTTSAGAPGPVVTFSSALTIADIPVTWATWSHGYTGDVYTSGGTAVTLLPPALTDAFFFYIEPNVFSTFTITVTAAGGGTSSVAVQPVAGLSGARGFGFWSPDTSITSVAISVPAGAAGFAVGEFGIHQVPEPATMLLLGGGLAALAARRRNRK